MEEKAGCGRREDQRKQVYITKIIFLNYHYNKKNIKHGKLNNKISKRSKKNWSISPFNVEITKESLFFP